MYRKWLKRPVDILASLMALIILLPLMAVLTAIGAVKMKGNPFFIQLRPGKNGRIFPLIKFRSMTCEKDADGKLLPDERRLTRYGRILRSTSLDELPELINVLKGDMSIVGPRPLLVEYLPLYNDEQKRRHDVRPGLTGYAQVNGRNAISWQERFKLDVEYVNNITLAGDIRIILKTVKIVLCKEGIHSENSATMEAFTGNN